MGKKALKIESKKNVDIPDNVYNPDILDNSVDFRSVEKETPKMEQKKLESPGDYYEEPENNNTTFPNNFQELSCFIEGQLKQQKEIQVEALFGRCQSEFPDLTQEQFGKMLTHLEQKRGLFFESKPGVLRAVR